MDAAQLSRWTRFASKGGIGKCIALQDCLALETDDLMFLKVCPSPLFFYLLPYSHRTTRSSSWFNYLTRTTFTSSVFSSSLDLHTFTSSPRVIVRASLAAFLPLTFTLMPN